MSVKSAHNIVNDTEKKTINRATSEVRMLLEKRKQMFNVIKLSKNKTPHDKILERERQI